jgi:hypothetical protein
MKYTIAEGKTPDVPNCPCCGAPTDKGMAMPECVQEHDEFGELLYHRLTWACERCGCRWNHGQYGTEEAEAQEEKPKPKDVTTPLACEECDHKFEPFENYVFYGAMNYCGGYYLCSDCYRKRINNAASETNESNEETNK